MTILFWGRNGLPLGAEKVFGPVRPQKNWGRKGFFGAETFGAETVRGRNGLHPGGTPQNNLHTTIRLGSGRFFVIRFRLGIP